MNHILLLAVILPTQFYTLNARESQNNDITDACFTSGKCIEDHNSSANITCFGAVHTYRSFSLAFTGFDNVGTVQSTLTKLESLRFWPKCWVVVQRLLCPVFYPKCENERISKVSYRLCKNAEKPCREAIERLHGQVPPFLQCNNETIFTAPSGDCDADDINNPRRRFINYNKINSTCLAPFMKPTEEPPFYSDFEGCGLSCTNDPSFTSDVRETMRSWILGCSVLAIIGGLFAFITKILSYEEGKGGRSGLVFDCVFLPRTFATFALALGMILSSAHVTCNKDDTLIMSQFQINGCLFSFILIYFSIHLELACKAVLGFYLYHNCRDAPQIGRKLTKKNVVISLIIAMIPSMILFIFIIHFEGYGGDGLFGICYISKESTWVLAVDTLLQCVYVIFAFLSWLMFIIRKSKAKAKLPWLTAYFISSCLLAALGIAYSVYNMSNIHDWNKSAEEFYVCKALEEKSQFNTACRNLRIPSVMFAYVFVIRLFGSGFITVFYITKETKDLCSKWKSLFGKITKSISSWIERRNRHGSAEHEGVRKVKKHQVMQQAYAKRSQLAENREITIDLESLSRYNLGSSVSEFMSNNFVEAIARGVQRRNAITDVDGPIDLRRSRSLDSLQSRASFKSIRFRKNSESWVYDSRANSLAAAESKFSLQQSELDRLESKSKWRRNKKIFKKKRLQRSLSSRQSSFTSQDLNMSQYSLASKDPRIFHGISYKAKDRNTSIRVTSPLPVKDAETQTSLPPDPIGIPGRPEMKEESTQYSLCHLPIDTATTTSSSQTEERLLANYPVEAHVTQINVHHDSGDSSSIPSSYDCQRNTIFRGESAPMQGSAFQLVHTQPYHSRGRRGGISEEIELTSGPAHAEFVETAHAISTPSS